MKTKPSMARLRAVLLIPLLILCQNQVKGLDYGCKCGVAKKGTLKGFRTQAATSGPVKNDFFCFLLLFENFCSQLPQETQTWWVSYIASRALVSFSLSKSKLVPRRTVVKPVKSSQILCQWPDLTYLRSDRRASRSSFKKVSQSCHPFHTTSSARTLPWLSVKSAGDCCSVWVELLLLCTKHLWLRFLKSCLSCF